MNLSNVVPMPSQPRTWLVRLVLPVVALIERDPDGRVRFHYVLVDFTAEAPAGEPQAGDDAAAVGWFALDELAGLGLWTETLRVIGEAAQRRGAG
mgnify:CR=1 FL=1